jgi:hypothetical protein
MNSRHVNSQHLTAEATGMTNDLGTFIRPAAFRRRGHRRAFAASVVLVGTVLAVAGCGGGSSSPGVASLGATTPSASSSSPSTASPLAFSECMRSHGISDFPDPNAQGGIAIQSSPGSDLNPNDPAFQAAQKACLAFRPIPSAAQQQQNRAQSLKFSQCMRSHGISDFPDPTAAGLLQLHSTPGSDLNPDDPAFQTAQKACAKYQQGGGQRITGTAPGSGA